MEGSSEGVAARRTLDLLKAAEAHLPHGVTEAAFHDLNAAKRAERSGRSVPVRLASAEARHAKKEKQRVTRLRKLVDLEAAAMAASQAFGEGKFAAATAQNEVEAALAEVLETRASNAASLPAADVPGEPIGELQRMATGTHERRETVGRGSMDFDMQAALKRLTASFVKVEDRLPALRTLPATSLNDLGATQAGDLGSLKSALDPNPDVGGAWMDLRGG